MKIIFITILILPLYLFSQFQSTFSFIENKGQFDGRNWQNSKIEYAVDYNNAQIYFTKKGLSYRFDKIIKKPKNNTDKSLPKRTNISELLNITWLNANLNVKIIAEDLSDNFYSYAIKDSKTNTVSNQNKIKAYKKITYINLYNNIDVEYTINSESGIKYSIILNEGANISDIKMKYSSKHTNVASETISYYLKSNQIKIKTFLAEITEHSPFSYYYDNKENLNSEFIFENNILSFNIDNYDNTRQMIIDPWIESPNFSTSTAPWEVETDMYGNVYVIGGETPMRLKKYNSDGVLQWTYSTPWDTTNIWVGTLATTNKGISYITSGTTPEIEKIDSSGNMLWHRSNVPNSSSELWSITFNNDTSKIIVGGTYSEFLGNYFCSAIYELDTVDGSLLYYQTFDTVYVPMSGVMPIEVRTIKSTKDGKYIYLTHNDIGSINQNFSTCNGTLSDFKVDNRRHYSYKTENFLPIGQNGGALKALSVSDDYIYTHSGDSVYMFNIQTGDYIKSVYINGGEFSYLDSTETKIIIKNAGLDVDKCGNVYVGSGDRVIKFNDTLKLLSEEIVSFNVYDIDVNVNGEVIAVGSENNNTFSYRYGKIQSVNFNACLLYNPVINVDSCIFICDTIVDFLPSDTVICQGQSLFLDAGNFETYLWNNGSENQILEVTEAGEYSIIVSDTNQCLNYDSIFVSVEICNSIKIASNQYDIDVYPNPAKDILFINSKNRIIKQVKLIDILGTVVYTNKNINNRELLSINISKFKSGVYFINLLVDNETLNIRFVIK